MSGGAAGQNGWSLSSSTSSSSFRLQIQKIRMFVFVRSTFTTRPVLFLEAWPLVGVASSLYHLLPLGAT